MTPSTLFVIPARGGSKGIPGKNIKPLNGKPLICYAIDNARHFVSDDDICLTTDSPKIRETAEAYGLKVPFLRPDSLATDTAGTYEVLLHAIEYYREKGREYERLVLLQPTSPFTRPEDIRAAIDLWTPECDMVVTVKEAATNPYYNAYETDADGFLHISKGEGKYTRRQDAPKVYEYNGAVYVITVASLMKSPLNRFKRIIPSEMDPMRSVDLDTPTDWLVAETIAKSLR